MRRGAALAAAAAAAAAAGVAVGPALAAGQEGEVPPDTFSVTAKAAPVVVEAAFPTVLPLQVETGLAATSLRISSQPLASAAAAPLWVPVAGALPETADVAALVDCTAASPGDRPEANCGGPGQEVAGLGRIGAASGHAEVQTDGPVRAGAEAGVSEVGTGPGGTEVVQLRGMASEVSASTEGGSVVGRARASVQGVTIAGVVRVGAVEVVAEGRLGAGAGASALELERPSFVAEVADIPVVIDSDGIRLLEVEIPGLQDQLQAVVNQTLAAAGITLELVPGSVEELDEGGTRLRGSTPGLRIGLSDPTTGNQLAVVLGRLELTMSATRFGELPPPLVDGELPAEGGAGAVPGPGPGLGDRPADAVPTSSVPPGGGARPPVTALASVPLAVDLEDWLPFYTALLIVAATAPVAVAARTRIPILQRRSRHDR